MTPTRKAKPKDGVTCPRCRWVRFKFMRACPRCSDVAPLALDTCLKDELFELTARHFRIGPTGGGGSNHDISMIPDAPPTPKKPRATVTPITKARRELVAA